MTMRITKPITHNNFTLKEVNKYDAVEFVQRFHYSSVMPILTKHYLGLYVGSELKAVTTLGWGTQPRKTIQKLFPSLNTDDYYEIGKQCVHDDMPKNTGTQLLSMVVKWMKENTPERLFLYTLADGIMSKVGIQYQAANFYYGGTFRTQVYQINGEKCHPRSIKPLLVENGKRVGKPMVNWLHTDFMVEKNIQKIEGLMFRYLLPLNKKAKKLLRDDDGWRQSDYPKDKDLVWWDITDGKNRQVIEQPKFTYEDAKYNARNINAHKKDINLSEFFL